MKEYKIKKGFIVQKIGKKTVIFDGEQATLFTFNETASVIFKKIKLGWEVNQIIGFLIKKYKISEERAKKDVLELIADMKKKKIIEHN